MIRPILFAASLSLVSPLLGAGPAAHACQAAMALNQTVNGTWSSACSSAHRSGRFARYYTFTLSATTSLRIDLRSSVDSYLYLLSGSGRGGAVLFQDDDSGGGTNARISRTLPPGTYTIEATTFSTRRTGSFTLALAGTGGGPGCVSALGLNQSTAGSWSSSCASTHRSGRFARYYTFSLSATTQVRIDLASAVDSYLYLLNGSGTGGSVLAQDDDSGGGSGNARISRTLAPGTYTIEATTFSSGRTGSFTLGLGAAGGGAGCVSALGLNQSTAGSWSSSCASTHRSGRYARFYTFSLSSTTQVRIDLTSAVDSYLYLLNGSGTGGAVVAQDDDSGGGNGNARISRTLAPGTYTIEATTFSSERTGSFTLALGATGGGGGGASCISTAPLNATTAGSWTAACTSVHRSGRYARYYTFFLPGFSTVQIDLTSQVDSYLYLLSGSGTGGAILAQDDDSGGGTGNARIRTNLAPGTYTVEATTFSAERTGSFALGLGEASRTTVFLVHGLAQRGGALNSLANTLRSSEFGIDTRRFAVDSGFDWGRCAAEDGCAADECEVSDGARALAAYIEQQNPSGPIVLIGYSLGGLLARDLVLNDYDGVASRRGVAALITLGTPNVGYPYCPIDDDFRCPTLARQMASHYRQRQDENLVVVSDYLFDLNDRWGRSSRGGLPGTWLAAAGTYCTDDRFCALNDVEQGCQDQDPESDGVVCAGSALHQLNLSNTPDRRWMDDNYSHTDNGLSWLVLCGSGGRHPLFNPPANGTLVEEIRNLINGLDLGR